MKKLVLTSLLVAGIFALLPLFSVSANNASVSQSGTSLIVSPTPGVGGSVKVTTGTTASGSAQENDRNDECIITDLKGKFVYNGNHLSESPVIGYFDNISENEDCPNEVTIHVFGSLHTEVEGDGWLESQVHVTSKTFIVPHGSSDFKIEFDVPNSDFCWYQVEATRTKKVKTPPYYHGDEMIDYVFVKDTDSCKPSPTATPTPIKEKEDKKDEKKEDKKEESSKPSEDIKGVTTLAPTGNGLLFLATLAGAGTLIMGGSVIRSGRKKE